MEKKLADIETRIAFQDQELQTLNEVIIDQQKQIDRLHEKISLLEDKIRDLKTSSLTPEVEETPPPHY